eukprot:9727092-Prorocentrum_lima.AAC.1
MTSSLVGSEMCIRDSGFEYTNVQVSVSNGMIRRRDANNLASWTISMGDCLLYTSDAADDM